jgi:hypothetical protein
MKEPENELSPEEGDQIIEDLRDALYGKRET